MIVASPKPVTELKQIIDRHKKVLFVGCGTCVTVCLAGGEREVGIAGYATRMARKLAGQPIELEMVTIERQCENEFIKDLAGPIEKAEAVVSFGCGAGPATPTPAGHWGTERRCSCSTGPEAGPSRSGTTWRGCAGILLAGFNPGRLRIAWRALL
jgi:hypothetical protein